MFGFSTECWISKWTSIFSAFSGGRAHFSPTDFIPPADLCFICCGDALMCCRYDLPCREIARLRVGRIGEPDFALYNSIYI